MFCFVLLRCIIPATAFKTAAALVYFIAHETTPLGMPRQIRIMYREVSALLTFVISCSS